MNKKISLGLAFTFVLTTPVLAQEELHPWRLMAEADAQAALRFVSENHPGASTLLGDKTFQDHLVRARRNIEQRLPLVSSFGGYSSLMQALAAEFRDGHIWSVPLLQERNRTWAGLALTRTAGKWVVAAQSPNSGEPALGNSEVLTCDGESFDTWARRRTEMMVGSPEVEANLARRAFSLFIDDGNPFIPSPKRCSFRLSDASVVEHALQWRPIPNQDLQAFATKSIKFPKAGLGVAEYEGGIWISLGSLGNGAAEVVKQVKEQSLTIQKAASIVLDLRGNSGGSSQFSDEIVQTIVGPERFSAAMKIDSDCDGAYWRASNANLEQVRQYQQRWTRLGNESLANELKKLVGELEHAIANKLDFAPSLPRCAMHAKPVDPSIDRSKWPKSATQAKLFVLTDRSCFSSCLLAVRAFRRLGAIQLGEETDFSTRYMEVREIKLPSGLHTFSTLQKVSLSAGDVGPFMPDVKYSGDLSDDAAVRKWVSSLLK